MAVGGMPQAVASYIEDKNFEEIEFVNPGKEGQKVEMIIPFENRNGWIIRRKK